MTAHLARIRIYPFKSLDGADVRAASLVVGGALALDRCFALFEADGTVINGKREPGAHALRVAYDADLREATFASTITGERLIFALAGDGSELEPFLERHFGRPVLVQRNDAGGFPDDRAAPGPTVVSSATLAAVAGWFPGLDAATIARRFRPNLEIDGVPPFWEDGLYAADEERRFRIGDVQLRGAYSCARCVVPSRDPVSGDPIPGFQKIIMEQRAASLPAWAARERFDHFYRLTVNTRGAASPIGARLRVGDEVSEPVPVESAADARTDPARGGPG